MLELLSLFWHVVLISLVSFTGSAQAVFYDVAVSQLHYVTKLDFTNFLGFGFASPGPQVFSFATFMGFAVASWVGALVGTLAIYFLPVAFAILVGRYLQDWMRKESIQHMIKIIGLAAAGVIFAVALRILNGNHYSLLYLAIIAASAVAINKKVSPLIIIASGLLLGLFLR